ncbi:MAG: diguanylate cyclase [Planctomycetota bacterium]
MTDPSLATNAPARGASATPVAIGRRILVVRDPQLGERVRAAVHTSSLSAEVAAVSGFLSAMGESVTQRFDAVVGPVDAMPDMIESTANALQRLAPHARLVATIRVGQEVLGERAKAAGFDAVLTEPAEPSSLLEALGMVPKPAPASAASAPANERPTPTETAPTSPCASTKQDNATEPKPSRVSADMPGDDERLLDAMLGGAGSLRETAVALAGQRFDLPGLTWSDAEPASADADTPITSALVAHQGQSLGWLVLTDGDAGLEEHGEAMARAAAWLGRWLTLDRRMAQLQDLSMRDELTGAWNRRYFNRFLERILERARSERQQVTVMVFDIDDFKLYNDRFGHATGDEILREVARLMQSLVRDHDVVARIGGDEFAVIFWDHEAPRRRGSKHPADVLAIAKRFQAGVCAHRFPKLLNQAKGTLTISGGIASYPWDGMTPDVLLDRADQMALQSKRQGKNAITVGQDAALTRVDGPSPNVDD